ncbi:MAG: HindVP family restriction endonuclease [Helicobacteraceae bacterium]|jgi:hypothetical protein|nr:HindVP family restriction endonuclease [Helicobacteraceae bacterium]
MPTLIDDSQHNSSGLFGITNSNRTPERHWSKNCFNSSFPAAVACYLLEKNIPSVYNKLEIINGEPKVVSSEISLREVFNCHTFALKELDFCFESKFNPYQQYSFSPIDSIDLVIKSISGKYLSPLEIKLTVLPTSNTSSRPEAEWGCELVVRSATTSYCALGMFDSAKNEAKKIREIFESTCSGIGSWENEFEMAHKTKSLYQCLNAFQQTYLDRQKPLLMQTIWKTKGQSPILADNAFDIIVWSDYAFSRLFIDGANLSQSVMSRPMRATARLSRCLWELSKSGKIQLSEIYRQMAFGTQTDKEFAIQGTKWREYTTSERILKPIILKSELGQIIDTAYIERLNPERRFDQTLYFTLRN